MGWSAFRKNGLTHHNANLSVKGYTLFTPADARGIYLLNMAGQVVKRWEFDDIKAFLVTFLPNGNLMVCAVSLEAQARADEIERDDTSDFDLFCLKMGGGCYTTLREYDWDGNLVWSYDNGRIHHDFHLCDNGDILLPEYVKLPDDLAAKVQGGYRNAPKKELMLGDDIIRINRKGEVVDRWHTWQMLDPVEDPIGPLQNKEEWTHMNSIDVMPDGQLLCSFCENSRVVLIDPDKREITWKLGDPEISMQHNATLLPNGNVQIFDNGRKRPMSIPYSQVIEVDPKTSEIVWRYKPGNSEQFYSGHISSAQRLAQGNVLICEGTSGRLFEITRSGEIVWEWLNPFVSGREDGRLYQWIYRAYRYPFNHPAFAGKTLDPANYAALNATFGLG